MAEPAAKPLNILLVEDNPADVDMTRQALSMGAIPHQLHVAEDGEEALRFLLREPPHGESPAPDLVLLDLKLPKASGYGLLAAIRAHRRLRHLTVIILTSSNLRDDEERSHEYAADHFVTKPVGIDAYVAAMKRIRVLATAT